LWFNSLTDTKQIEQMIERWEKQHITGVWLNGGWRG
jgi:hypothetical protein